MGKSGSISIHILSNVNFTVAGLSLAALLGDNQ